MEDQYKRHGGPWDRGSADAWYGRQKAPHYFIGATYKTEIVREELMTNEQIQAYMDGYDQQDERKDWG